MSLDIKLNLTPSSPVLSPKQVVDDVQSSTKSLSVSAQASKFSSYSETKFIDGSNAVFFMNIHEAANRSRCLFESWQGDANAVMLMSGLLSATVATFLSHAYLAAAQPNLQDISDLDLSRIYVLLTNPIGVTLSSSATPSEPWMVSIPTLIYGLWLTSMVISLGCATFTALLQRRVRQCLLMTQPRHGPRGRVGVCMYATQEGSLMDIESSFRALHTSLLVSIFLFLWGLSIQLFRSANPPSVLFVFGISATFFLGQYLILLAFRRFPSYDAEASLV